MLISRIDSRKLGVMCERVGVAFDVGQDPIRIFEREAGDGKSLHCRHMTAIASRVKNGSSLSDAILAQGNYFPDNFARLIEVGEKTGRLDRVLDRMATYYKDSAILADEFTSAILWPLIQLFLGLIVVSVLIYVPAVVAPNEAEVADLLGIGLIGGRGLAIFWAIVLAIATLLLGGFVLFRNGKLGFIGDRLTRTPVLGRALLTFDEATFIQSLALAIESGLDAWTAIGLSFNSSSSTVFKSKADSAQRAIRQGRELHSVLADTGLFSRDTIEAVQLGEESGRLAETLDKHGNVLRMRVKFAMATITQLASSIVWILISAILITVIFRVFFRYVSLANPESVERLFNRGDSG
jgi:type II secretory pathway component PulF